MLEVDDEIAFDQLRKIEQLVDLSTLSEGATVAEWAPLALASEEFGFGDNDQAG